MSLRLLLLGLSLCVASAAYALTPPSTYMPSADTDSMLVLVEIRDLAAIEHDFEEAAARRAAAEVSEAKAAMLQARSVTKIKIKESEIASLKAEIDQAKAMKDETKKAELENVKKVAELEKGLLQRRDDLRKYEIEYAEAEVEFHGAAMKSFEAELALAHLRARRAEFAGVTASTAAFEEAHKLAKETGEAEGKTLKAKIEAAEKGKTLAAKAVEISKARQKVYEARRKVVESAAGK